MKKNDIKVVLEVALVYPYKKSMDTLLDFARIWDSKVIYGSTRKEKLLMFMPKKVFKRMFGGNPRNNIEYDPPINSESFIKSVKVKKIIT